MKTLSLFLSLSCAGWSQAPGTHGHSSTFHTPAQRPGYLGVGVAEVTPDRAAALKLPEVSGVEVKHMDEGSPASKAGLKVDDVILELNEQKVQSVVHFVGTIGVSSPGSKMALVVWRGGAKRTVTAVLDARVNPLGVFSDVPDGLPNLPTLDIMPFPNPLVGIDGEALTPQLAQYFGVKEGVLIRSVNARTPAERAGLKAGDVIIKVGGTPVTSPREISAVVRAAHKAIAFTIVRNHREMTFSVEIALESDPWRKQGAPREDAGPSLALWLVR